MLKTDSSFIAKLAKGVEVIFSIMQKTEHFTVIVKDNDTTKTANIKIVSFIT